MIGANTTISTKRFGSPDADGHVELEGSNTLTGIPAYIEKVEGSQSMVDEDNQKYYYTMEIDQDVDLQEDDQVTDADSNVYNVLEIDKQKNDELTTRIIATITKNRG